MSGTGEVPGSHQRFQVPGTLVDPHHPAAVGTQSRRLRAALGGLTLIPGAAAEAGLSVCLQSVVQPRAQQALLLDRPRAPSVLSCLSDGDLRGPGLRSRSQELPEMDSFSSEDPRDTETSTSASTSDVGFLPSAMGPNTSIEEEAQEEPPPLGLLPDMLHLAEGSFVEQPGWRDLGVGTPDLSRGSPFHNEALPGSQGGPNEGDPEDTEGGPGLSLERPLQEVLDLLRSVDPAPPQLRELEYQILTFRERLKVCALSAGGTPCLLMVP